MYIGNVELKETEDYGADEETYKITKKTICSSPGILRIFVEILSNAIDNNQRSREANIASTYIKIFVNKETGETSIVNDGDFIPIEMNLQEKMYNHTLIFGNLLSGSNFDDENQERLLSGLNGIGGKCTNIFSKQFTVNAVDPTNKLSFEQTWTNNMKNPNEPIIKSTKLIKAFTNITYFPDFARFGLEGYTDDIVSQYMKLALDTAVLTKLKVYFNDILIPVNNLSSYAKLYDCPTDDEMLLIKTQNSEVVLTPSSEYEAITFVNGIFTKDGGVHLDAWSEALFRPLVEKFTKKGKPPVNIKDIKQFFRIFVISTVINPRFESQSKHRLEAPKVEAVVKSSDISKIMKWSVIDDIQEIIKAKEMVVMKKSEKKKKGYVKIEGLDQANFAGTKTAHLCSLILCEGLSAKTFAVSGITKGVYGQSGRDYFGILPLRGKCFGRNTPILLWDGSVKFCQDIRIGDTLVNEKGEPTKVLKLFSGIDDLYEVKQMYGDNYVVSSGHTLTFKMLHKKSYIWDEYHQTWNLYFYQDEKLMVIKFISDEGKLISFEKMIDVYNSLQYEDANSPMTIDILIEDYMSLDTFAKDLLEGFKLEKSIQWEPKHVYLDPYIFGLWLGDGNDNGTSIITDELYLLNEVWKPWLEKIELDIVKSSNGGYNVISSNEINYFIEILTYYDLIENKHIPTNFMINCKDVRMNVLAGLIDSSDGQIMSNKIEIKFMNIESTMNNIKFICQTLGFHTLISHRKNLVRRNNVTGEKMYTFFFVLEIYGNDLDMIPTKHPSKKIPKIIRDPEFFYTQVMIQKEEKGEYFGFMTDKTHRFLLGDFTVSHNCLNVRNSNPATIAKNAVITDLIQALGLQHGLDYIDEKNYKTLDYGKVILLTDADCDGIHIEGLIMNFFHSLFPTLLQRSDPFLVSMKTPIVRVFNPKGDILFYDENRFKKFAEKQEKNFKSKYYKGLGTTKPEDVPDIFGEKMVQYIKDDETDVNINKVFHKKFSDQRKLWLENYDPNPSFSLDDNGKITDMDMSLFLNNEIIKFSHNDCRRSIPSLFDGLKSSQRKCLFCIKKRNLTFNKQSLKVAQLGGYVAEHSNYHHGEQNLYETIVKMAQDFVGSNNIPLLYRDGAFGTRNSLGGDSASPRYIFTKMESLTPLIFREEDDALLEYLDDDGDTVEPRFYVPIIPMVLVNGATGIGSGWSSSIPCYNPLDIIKCIKIWLENNGKIMIEDSESNTITCLLPELIPWYRGFLGKIEIQKERFITYGVLNKDGKKARITELPIGMSIDKFKEMLENWLIEKQIKKFVNHSTPKIVDFTIFESDDGFSCNLNNMKLSSSISVSNMVLFNEKEQLKKYTIEQIIHDFCVMRIFYYEKRKIHMIKLIEKDLRILSNKARFIHEIINNDLIVMNVDEDMIVTELEKRKYDKSDGTAGIDDATTDEKGGGYNYLLRLQVRTFTAGKVKQINSDIKDMKKLLHDIKTTTEKQMWLNDLAELEEAYPKWLKNMENSDNKKQKKK